MATALSRTTNHLRHTHRFFCAKSLPQWRSYPPVQSPTPSLNQSLPLFQPVTMEEVGVSNMGEQILEDDKRIGNSSRESESKDFGVEASFGENFLEIEEEKAGIEIVPMLIFVDPERDTVEQVREYVKEFHPKSVGLTSNPEENFDNQAKWEN